MLAYFASFLTKFWGPFRLFESHLVLICLSALFSALLTLFFLPKLWRFLPRDQGKPFVKNSEEAKGKPTGAGIIIVFFFLLTLLLVMPFNWSIWGIALCLTVCMLSGFFDDASEKGWGELKKALWDAVVALAAAAIISKGQSTVIWLPLIKGSLSGGGFLVPFWLYLPLASALLWLSINVVNCSDGVDGMAGSLSLLALCGLGIFLYGITGHITLAKYLLIPHNPEGANWAIMLFAVAGGLAGYIWYNANPSLVLMGDAGSRFLGLLIGIGVLLAGNPFLYLAVAPILLFNGGIGLIKLTLLRILKKTGFDVRPPMKNMVNTQNNTANYANEEETTKQLLLVRMAHRVRCPIHDHCRKNLDWSVTQVVTRFMLIQSFLMPILLLLIIKLR